MNNRSRGENSISFATQRANTAKYKIVFVGDQGVGKSSIITSFIKNQFDNSHNPTVGVDFVSKNLNIKGKNIRLQLWDTAGQERFRSLIPSYLKDCNAAFIVFDIANQTSFQSLTKWIDFVKQSRGRETLMFILGNKSDLQSERVVDKNRVEELSKAENIEFYEISAKTGQNLNQVFRILCSQLTGFDLDAEDMHLSQVKNLRSSITQPNQKQKSQQKENPNQTKLPIKSPIDPQNKKLKIVSPNTNQPTRVRSTCC